MPRARWEALCGRSHSVCSAYNTPPLADAGAAVVLMSQRKAHSLGLTPLVRILGFVRHDCRPEDFPFATVEAVRTLERVLAEAGRPTDFPLMEMNESFGLQRLVYRGTWPDRLLNPWGGSVALKHPLGAAGARLLTTLIHTMLHEDLPRGIAGICFGGGGASAIAVERT
jgi:acetyl-CoA C-acetyltransferase